MFGIMLTKSAVLNSAFLVQIRAGPGLPRDDRSQEQRTDCSGHNTATVSAVTTVRLLLLLSFTGP